MTTSEHGRVPRRRPTELDASERGLYDRIVGGPRSADRQFPLTDEEGGLLGPFNAMLLSPDVGEALQAVGAAIRYRTALTPRCREIAILLVASAHASGFERAAHEAVGRSIGLTEAECRALRDGDLPGLADPTEAETVSTVRALLGGDLSDALWARARGTLGERAVFELTTLVGYYSTLALQLRVFRVDAPPASDAAPFAMDPGAAG